MITGFFAPSERMGAIKFLAVLFSASSVEVENIECDWKVVQVTFKSSARCRAFETIVERRYGFECF